MALLPLYTLSAQEEEKKPEAGIFSLARLLEAAEYAADGCWRPDWPLEFPPDAFNADGDDWVSITVTSGVNRYSLKRDQEGRIIEFPFLFDGVLVQAAQEHSQDNDTQTTRLKAMYLASAEVRDEGGGGNLANIEALEYHGAYPYMMRVRREGMYYFILLEKRTNFISEAWFDEEGILLGGYEHRLVPVSAAALGLSPKMRIEVSQGYGEGIDSAAYNFDSRSLVTGVRGREGEFFIQYYKERLPRYWERKPAVNEDGAQNENDMPDDGSTKAEEEPGRYSFQWDERNFLVRLSGSRGEGVFADSRYDYVLDHRGNWTLRQETKMSSRFGYLAAGPTTFVSRFLEYAAPVAAFSEDALTDGEILLEDESDELTESAHE